MTRFGRLGLGAAILCAGIVVGGVLLSGRGAIVLGAQGVPAETRPTALLQVEPPRAGSLDALSIRNDIRTNMMLMQTRKVLEQALADRDVAKLECLKGRTDAASWLAAHLLVENPEGTLLIRVSMAPAAGALPQEQATLVNAVAKAFVERDDQQERRGLEDRQEQLEGELVHRQRQRHELEHELDSLVRRDESRLAGSVPRDMLASYAMDLRRKRLEVDFELAGVKAVIARRKGKPAANQADSDERARLEDRLAALEAQGNVVDPERKQIEMALGQSSRSSGLSVTRVGEALRHHDAAIKRLEERRGELAMERSSYHPRILFVDPAVAR